MQPHVTPSPHTDLWGVTAPILQRRKPKLKDRRIQGQTQSKPRPCAPCPRDLHAPSLLPAASDRDPSRPRAAQVGPDARPEAGPGQTLVGPKEYWVTSVCGFPGRSLLALESETEANRNYNPHHWEFHFIRKMAEKVSLTKQSPPPV